MKRVLINLIIFLIFAAIIFLSTQDSSYARTWGDDFNDGNLDGWTEMDTEPIAVEPDAISSWQAEAQVLDVKLFLPPHTASVKSFLELTAFPIEAERFRVKCTILNATRDGGIGILIGKQPPWGARWRLSYRFFNRYIEGPVPEIPGRNSDRIAQYEIENIEVVFESSHFQLLSMGKPIAEFRDESFGFINLIGIMTRTPALNYHATLDNFVISGPDIPQGPSFPVHLQDKVATTWGKLKRR